MDIQLVEKIVHEVKSQGVFDEFRKDSMADVDTKPAYQNLRQRVENTVKKFLAEQKWTPETNKNQLREKLRRHITESGFLDVGVERIVDQVVNPKIGSVFQPRIEEIAYNYLGLPPPPKKYEPPPPPLMHPLPPLPLGAPPPSLNVEACSLLPHDLEQVSPDSDKATVKSEIEGDDNTNLDMEMDEKIIEDEDESPPFEPLIKKESDIGVEAEVIKIKAEVDESTLGENLVKKDYEISSMIIKAEVKENTESQGSNNFPSVNLDKDVSHSMDCRNSQDSQLSSVSSDTRLSSAAKDESILRSSQEEAVTANISEEAQMPKFNENSSEPNGINGGKEIDSELHFDIKKDEIKFEGTERKSKMDDSHESPLPEELKCPMSAESASVDNKNDSFKFESNNNSNIEQKEDDLEITPNAAQELSFGSSIEDSTSIPTNTINQLNSEGKEKEVSIEDKSPLLSTPKQQQQSTPTPTPTATPTATPTPPPLFAQTPTTTPSPVSTQKTEKEYHTTRHSSSSSSSKHKKHLKERRRSHDREKDKDRYRNSKDGKVSSRHHNSSGSGASGNKNSSSKHSSSSSKYSSSSSHHKSSHEKYLEKSSSSSHSSSKQTKRNHSSSSSHRDHSSSSSNTSSKRTEQRKDDHHEAKPKPQRRKSTDSNDDDGDKGASGTGKSNSQYSKSSASNSRNKAKSGNDVNQSPSSKNNDTQKEYIAQESTENMETFDKPQLHKQVVILNDLLENPHTQFIHLDTRGHLTGSPLTSTPVNICPSPIMNNYIENYDKSNNGGHCADLLYFEDIQTHFVDRINLLNDIMDLCRRAVNSFRFDTPVDEGIEVSSEDDFNHIGSASLSSLSTSLKRQSDIKYEDFEKTPRKRCKLSKTEENVMKTSPTPSDISVSSKENEEIDKNTDLSKKLDRHKAAIQKLSQQQRYSSDDLYKPRPILGQRSRRRGMDSIV